MVAAPVTSQGYVPTWTHNNHAIVSTGKATQLHAAACMRLSTLRMIFTAVQIRSAATSGRHRLHSREKAWHGQVWQAKYL